MGRLTAATTSYTFLTARNFTVGYSYDAASNRTGFTDPENGSTAYAYDTLNRLQTLTPPSAFSGTGSFGFSYDALSRRTQMTRPNNVSTNYAYDNLSRLQSVLHQLAGSTIDGATYTVDNAGNRTAKTDQRTGVASNYGYDAIYELTGVTQGTNTTESYTYDPVGNRLSSLGVSPYSVNVSNQLTSTPSTSYIYDSNGDTLTKTDSTGATGYTWDFENRLTGVTLPGTGGTVSFKYDPFGRRIYKSSSSGTSIYAYDFDNLIEETNFSGMAVARYLQALNIDEPLAMLRASAISYFQADSLGSITSLSNAAGSVANTYTYDSFGKLTGSTGSLTNPFQYTARDFDTESGLYYMRARYFDPTTGRFLTEDPIGAAGGSLNFYSYALGDPVNASDPTGLKFKIVGDDWWSFWDAFIYLSRDPGMNRILQQLLYDDIEHTIVINSNGRDGVDVFGTLHWDPHRGLKCDGGEGAAISPALSLGHELGHLSHGWWRRTIDSATPTGDAYDTVEERNTIQQIENPAARTLGEGVRNDHRGKATRVKSPRTIPNCECERPEQSSPGPKPTA